MQDDDNYMYRVAHGNKKQDVPWSDHDHVKLLDQS